jgi:hypothetical protein
MCSTHQKCISTEPYKAQHIGLSYDKYYNSKAQYMALVGLGGPVVSKLAREPKASSSNLAKDEGFLWVIKICSTCFLERGSKAVGPMS